MRLALALTIGAAAGLAAATQPISDTDLWWHLATGRETLAHGFVRTDLFSWTVRGGPVSTDQWLGQIALYGAYALASWWGIALVRVIAVVALVALVVWNASIGGVRRPAALALAALPALIETRVLWVDRPELLGLVCFAALLPLLRLGRSGNTRALGACVALVLAWANVHGSFALGAVLVWVSCAEGALRDIARRRVYLTTALATAIASIVTPAGLGTWTAPGFHFLTPPRDIQEWALIDPATPLGVAYLVTLALVVLVLFRGPRPDARELVILLPVALLSLTAVRQAPLLAIVAAPLFARAVDALLPAAASGTASRARWVFLAGAAALFVLSLGILPREPDERSYPVAALTSLPNGDGTLARYEWGGWLIWRAPATPVFIDGRLTPYLGSVLDDYRRIISAAPGWEEALARRRVRTLLVTPEDPVTVRAQELGWRVIARSARSVLIAVP
ncbi:MAG TPA: hypothetical protein VEU77_09755 [Candidatus Acidoferrales bacterium]|nr:hypothetical protein [Candidatus Acidoferrales bacterium]